MPQTKSAVRKALVPIAGKGARLMPITSALPKAMFPIVDSHGRIRPILHIILEQAVSVGIEHVGIVTSLRQTEILQQYVNAVYESSSNELPCRIEYIIQSLPIGFGDAVLQGADFIDSEPFMLFLGDHIYIEEPNRSSCAAQVAKAFDSTGGVAMIGVQLVSMNELSKVGVAGGVQINQDIYQCTAFIEKPDLQTAHQRLTTIGLPNDTFLAHCGIYIFTPEIFDCISEIRTQSLNAGREVELAEAQVELLRKYPGKYFLYKIAGRAYDVGTPISYAEAQDAFRKK